MAAVDIVRGEGKVFFERAAVYAGDEARDKLRPMRLLAVDTTTAHGSLALLDEETVAGEVRTTSTEGHSRWLVPALESLLTAQGWRLDDLTGLAVTVGPGSFTGLRVGIATVQGLALATKKPCVGVIALDALASRAAGQRGQVVALMDAWRDEVYARIYEDGRPRGEPFACPVEGIRGRVDPRATLLGDGTLRYAERLRAALPEAQILETDLFLAVPLGRLALGALRRGEGAGPEALKPLYVRDVDIRPAVSPSGRPEVRGGR
jgi:tRNA threonylcarbamoyladenosine biosynthesis protein TsaB